MWQPSIDPEQKAKVMAAIRDAGFVTLRDAFSGGGDEGQHDEMIGTTPDDEEVSFEYGEFDDLWELVETVTDQFWDWNGSGSYGTMIYDVLANTMTMECWVEEYVQTPTLTL